jgi:hypothetical protein
MFITLILMLVTPLAHADFTYLCGKDREKGVEAAEIAFIDSLDMGSMQLYLSGEEIQEGKVGFKGTESGEWIVGVDRGADQPGLKLVFSEKSHTVQMFSLGEKQEKMGEPLECRFERKAISLQ